jgi:hypothetical protein
MAHLAIPLMNQITDWEPEDGWILLLPSRLPDIDRGIILPESYTRKNNSGICFAPTQGNAYYKKECLFAQHQEYQVIDTETGVLFYLLEISKIILTREPPPNIERASWGEGRDGFQLSTVETSQK